MQDPVVQDKRPHSPGYRVYTLEALQKRQRQQMAALRVRFEARIGTVVRGASYTRERFEKHMQLIEGGMVEEVEFFLSLTPEQQRRGSV